MFSMILSFKTKIILGLVLAILVIAGVYFFKQTLTPSFEVNMSKQTVIKEMRELERLETASFTIEKVIDAGTSGGRIQELLYGDRILLIAHGEVIAGVDLSKLEEKDISIENGTIGLNLPPPQILVTRLDNEETRVYDRRQGILSRGNDNLESEARREAENAIKEAACTGGILNEAAKNARSQLTALFKTLGFTTVVINILPGTC
jgi:hypothetical protein